LSSWEFKSSQRACINEREYRDHDHTVHEATVKI